MNDLKSCPFCGSNDITIDSYGVMEFWDRPDEQMAEVECNNCGDSVTCTSKDTLNDSCSEGAIRKWNARTE